MHTLKGKYAGNAEFKINFTDYSIFGKKILLLGTQGTSSYACLLFEGHCFQMNAFCL